MTLLMSTVQASLYNLLYEQLLNAISTGEDLVFLVWGTDDPVLDKVHYATANPPWWTNETRWWDCPIHPIGSAHPLPHHPRPAEAPYPS